MSDEPENVNPIWEAIKASRIPKMTFEPTTLEGTPGTMEVTPVSISELSRQLSGMAAEQAAAPTIALIPPYAWDALMAVIDDEAAYTALRDAMIADGRILIIRQRRE